MSATMARQGGRVQLEQSDMHLALNMANMANEVFSRATIEDIQKRIKTPCAKVWEEKKRGVVFPGHNKVKAAIERHPAMVRENSTVSCLPCQNGTAKNPQTRWRRKGTSAPPARLAPPRPGTPPAPSDDSERTQRFETEGARPRYLYIHNPLPSAKFFNLDPYAKDRPRDKHIIPDFLTDQRPSTD